MSLKPEFRDNTNRGRESANCEYFPHALERDAVRKRFVREVWSFMFSHFAFSQFHRRSDRAVRWLRVNSATSNQSFKHSHNGGAHQMASNESFGDTMQRWAGSNCNYVSRHHCDSGQSSKTTIVDWIQFFIISFVFVKFLRLKILKLWKKLYCGLHIIILCLKMICKFVNL